MSDKLTPNACNLWCYMIRLLDINVAHEHIFKVPGLNLGQDTGCYD
jgi:hypothetical protein